MPSQLTVKITNDSPTPGTAVVYQQYPGGAGASTLAWMVAQAPPGFPTTLAWGDQLDFVWGQPGNLPVGAIFSASQAMPADPSGNNQITLSCQGGACRFTDPRPGGPPGQLSIFQDGSVVPGQVAVGIGMSNSATQVVPARPNMTANFATDNLQYRIAFGSNFQQGQVLDPGTLQNSAQLVFPPGVTVLTAVYGADGRWSISPG